MPKVSLPEENEVLALALDTLKINKQALIFAPSRASAEKTAEEISQKTPLFLPELSRQILKAASTPTQQCRRLSNCVKKGIAFHHAGLLSQQKAIIEQEFKKGNIKIICATPTLAFGVSFPAFRVIIKSLKRYGGRWGMDWIPVLEYHQMSGRAGRPEYESYGESLVLAKNEKEKSEIYERYLCGTPEEIYSKLAVEPVFRTYLLSLIAAGLVRSQKELLHFFSQTFWAFQFRDMNKIKLMIGEMLSLLAEYKFIKVPNQTPPKSSDFISAGFLNNEIFNKDEQDFLLQPTLLGQRVSQLYLDPFTAHHLINCLKKAPQNENLAPFSFLQMISHTLEMFPLLKVRSKEHEELQEQLVQKYNQLLQSEPTLYDSDYDDFLNSFKTALFFEEWLNEKDEDYLLEKYNIRPGEIHTKLEIADWLLYSSAELAKLLPLPLLLKELNKLRLRMQYGAKEELLPLLKLKGIGRQRARKLYNNKIKDIKDLNNTSLALLSSLLGPQVAQSLKQQLETPPEPVKKGKRKGQLSIAKFEKF